MKKLVGKKVAANIEECGKEGVDKAKNWFETGFTTSDQESSVILIQKNWLETGLKPVSQL